MIRVRVSYSYKHDQAAEEHVRSAVENNSTALLMNDSWDHLTNPKRFFRVTHYIYARLFHAHPTPPFFEMPCYLSCMHHVIVALLCRQHKKYSLNVVMFAVTTEGKLLTAGSNSKKGLLGLGNVEGRDRHRLTEVPALKGVDVVSVACG